MERIVVALAIAAVAVAVAAVLRRRRPDPTFTVAAGVPDRVDRGDFAHPGAPWLYVLFSSATCESCPVAAESLRVVEGEAVAVDEVEYSARRDLHRRYGIDAVPLTLLVDADGLVRDHFLGRTSPEQLSDALDRARGSGTGS